MVGKLSKRDDIFYLFVDASWSIASTDAKDNRDNKLSLKNCEEVDRGYDLDELAMGYDLYENINFVGQTRAYKAGFQKALEVNSDKRFTFKEMVDCWNKALNFQEHKETLGDHMQSLRQTEWDVEVEMEYVGECNGNNGEGCFQDSPGHNCGCFERRPKLDADGCLILKCK